MISRDSLPHFASMLNKDERARTSRSIPNGSTHAAFKMAKESNKEDEEEDALDRTSWEQLQVHEDSEDIDDDDGPMAVGGMHSRRSQIE
jgi:hypothetical protein